MFLNLLGILLSSIAFGQSKSGHLVTVTTDNVPGVQYSLALITDKQGSIIEIHYKKDQKIEKKFSVKEGKSGVTLLRESGVPVITIKASSQFSANTGGSVEFRVLRKGGLFSGFHYRYLPLQLRNEAQGWTLYSDLPDGQKEFNEMFMEALRDNDPAPDSRILGTGKSSEDAIGIKNIQLSLNRVWADTVNTIELKE